MALTHLERPNSPAKMTDGIGPLNRRADGQPDWQVAHDDLILMMFKNGSKEWDVYEALGRMATSAEINRRHRALKMRATR